MNSNVTDELIIKNKKNLKGYKKVGLKKLKKSNILEKKKIRGFFNRFGIARVKGLDFGVKVKFGRVIYFQGMLMSLAGCYVIPTGKLVSVSIGKTIFGRDSYVISTDKLVFISINFN